MFLWIEARYNVRRFILGCKEFNDMFENNISRNYSQDKLGDLGVIFEGSAGIEIRNFDSSPESAWLTCLPI